MKMIKAFYHRSDPIWLWGALILLVSVASSLYLSNEDEEREISDSTMSATELMSHFDAQHYTWPPTQVITDEIVASFPEEIATLPVTEKKALFFRILLPMVMQENARIAAQRVQLTTLLTLDPVDIDSLKALAVEYRVIGDLSQPEVQAMLLSRVDEIPVSLALAQAANESAWGTSRFTKVANNLFGEWTYNEAEGVVPQQRDPDKKHFVRKFGSLHASVRSYMNNLNRGQAYQMFRERRAELRDRQAKLDGAYLAGGLLRYSERGEEYVDEIRRMIRQNKLESLQFPAG